MDLGRTSRGADIKMSLGGSTITSDLCSGRRHESAGCLTHILPEHTEASQLQNRCPGTRTKPVGFAIRMHVHPIWFVSAAILYLGYRPRSPVSGQSFQLPTANGDPPWRISTSRAGSTG